MSKPRRFLTRRRTLVIGCVLTLLFGLPMLHPYPRQSLFGPTIRGKPWCVWEDAIRQHVHRDKYENSWWFWLRDALGTEPEPMSDAELYDHAAMVPLLVELAHDHDRSVRGQVLVVLFNYESLRDPAWIPVLQRRIVEDSYQENRLQAALLLWDLAKDKRALPVIVRDLKNRDCIELEDVTMTIHDGGAALQRFARICTEAPEMMPAMLELARHPDVSQYGSACLFAGTQLGEKGTAILIACLENKEASVRTSAGLQLVGRGPKAKDAIPALVKCLNDPDQNMRWIARDALMAIDPARFKQLSVEQEGK